MPMGALPEKQSTLRSSYAQVICNEHAPMMLSCCTAEITALFSRATVLPVVSILATELAFPRCGEHPHGIADLNKRLDCMPCFHGSLLRSKSHSCVGVDVQGLALGRFQCTCFVKTPAQANRLAVR